MNEAREIESFSEDEAREELDRLHEALSKADRLYFESDAPEMTDAAYDALKRRYQAIEEGAFVRTHVRRLDGPARKEEIARMLAGATITAEARAAAGKLLSDVA